jgi:hypothetical protein
LVCDGALKNLSKAHAAGTWQISLSGDWRELTQFHAHGQAWISYDVSAYAEMVDLTTLNIYNTAGTGDIGTLSGLTALSILSIRTTAIYGDLAELAPLTSLTILRAYTTAVTYSTAVHPAGWASAEFRCYSNGWTTAMVDQFLIDHDAIGPGACAGVLHIAGTNDPVTAAPSAGYTAADSLNAKGKVLTINGWP